MSSSGLKTQNDNLAGAEKAAALLLAMGKDSALKLADFFSKQEIEQITAAANKLNTVDVSIVEGLVQEFGAEYIGSGMFADTDGLSEFFESLSGEEDAPEIEDVSNADRSVHGLTGDGEDLGDHVIGRLSVPDPLSEFLGLRFQLLIREVDVFAFQVVDLRHSGEVMLHHAIVSGAESLLQNVTDDWNGHGLMPFK